MSRSFLFFILFSSALFGQTVNVTILLNTATVPDTIRSTAFVQIRGNKLPLINDSTSPVIFSRIAGDYWKATAAFTPHDTVEYEFFVNGNRNKFSGYESTSPRLFIVGDKDTTLPLQYYFGSVSDTTQYWRPFVETDSIEVLFRVNMELQEDFQQENRKVGIRGGFAPSNWETTIFMKQENQHANPGSREYNAGNFWSAIVRFPRPNASQKIEYKFVQHNSSDTPFSNPLQWEDAIKTSCADNDVDGNRFFTLKPTQQDTTLAYKYWTNGECGKILQRDSVIITFTVDATKSIQNNNYVVGDSLLLITGLSNSYTQLHTILLKKQGLTFNYQGTDTLIYYESFKPKKLLYKYVARQNGADKEDIFIDYGELTNSNYHGRKVNLPFDGTTLKITVKDTAKSVYSSNRVPYFKSNRKITRDVSITFICDLRPPYYQVLINNDTLHSYNSQSIIVNKDSIYHWGISINGIGFDSKGWLPWGDTLYADQGRKLFDDGTHGDAYPNDKFYSRLFPLKKDSSNTNRILLEYKYGIKGLNNETGQLYNISRFSTIDDKDNSATIIDQFGDQFPIGLSQWDYDARWAKGYEGEGVININTNIVDKYELEQNFPNPFNPSTTISFSVPSSQSSSGKWPGVRGIVTLTIYDLLGRTVATLVNEHLDPGTYSVSWNAHKSPSGLYFYRLHSGDFTQTKRMLLLK